MGMGMNSLSLISGESTKVAEVKEEIAQGENVIGNSTKRHA